MNDKKVKSLDEYTAETNEYLKKQDKQWQEISKAQELMKNKDYESAIRIMEKIMFKDGLIVMGVSWPFVLADLYYKAGKLEEALKYADFIQKGFGVDGRKIIAYRDKVLRKQAKQKQA